MLPDDHPHACRDIKHLYHYYLHGKEGRRPGHLKPSAAKDGILPEIIIQRLNNNRLAWRKSLIDVSDDMESKILEVYITQVLPSELAMCQHPFPGYACKVLLLCIVVRLTILAPYASIRVVSALRVPQRLCPVP